MKKIEANKNLTPEQYDVLFNKATEAPFSGEYDVLFKPGTYACANCGTKLFASATKFDAHCGWPSFYDALPGTVTFIEDNSMGVKRTEVTCSKCGGHLGHVFEGEGFNTPTDQRYCVNSLSLKFIPTKS
ncbi:MAG TPA: peptide-methionine (R)-S-oxide reductase MsrB [Candidatus Saccharibacteria bacterium]|nr:peptide-methionine (R)-S-oxide reductase MsrB [Candidatus Saccharibacteria bacterium]HRQ07030.1 peptide-methionine (R)-S-oxide reductase MsrB [Candidatus Saccharibacteria bacterium]